MIRMFLIVNLVALSAVAATGCASKSRTADVTMKIGPAQLSPAEIGGDATSFADTYVSHLVHVADQYFEMTDSPVHRAQANAFLVDTALAAYAVASDPNPIAAMLDMIVLASLSKWAVEEHWSKSLDEEPTRLIEAFRKGDAQAWDIAARMLDEDQRQALRGMIEAWTQENPPQRYVSNVRFSDFSELRRQMHSTKAGAQSLFGLFGLDPMANLNPTTREIERSRMLAERSFFYVKRLPLIITASANQFYFDIAASEEAAQLRANIQTFADSAANLARVADEMPDRIAEKVAVERDAAIRQVHEAIAAEREALYQSLDAEEPRMRGLMSELRQTLDSATALTEAVAVLKPPKTDVPSEPMDINDVRAVVEQTTLAAGGLNQLVQSVDRVLAPDDMKTRLTQLDLMLGQAQLRGQKVVDRAFLLGALLVGVILVASIVKMLFQRRLAPPR
jgi:hypothetical protein